MGERAQPLNLDDLQQLLWSFAAHRVVTVASRTGVLAAVAGRVRTADELAGDLALDPLALGKVLRALTALGVTRAAGDGYRLVGSLERHLDGGPADLAPFVEHLHHLYERWGDNLERWVRGEPWETQRRGTVDRRAFGSAMRAMGTHVAEQLARAVDLSGARRMLDLGGGFGHYAQVLCAANPELRATVVDVAEVADLGRQQLAGSPLADRIAFTGGDYLEVELEAESYDLALLANVLHQELPARARQLVARAAAATARGGRVVAVDFAIDEQQRSHVLGALFAINMRSSGDTYTESTIRGWFAAAGLDQLARVDISPIRWAIIGHRR